MPSSANSLILSTAVGYQPAAITPFLKSLKETSYRGKVVLFVDKVDNSTLDFMRESADEIVFINQPWDEGLKDAKVRAGIKLIEFASKTKGFRKYAVEIQRTVLKWLGASHNVAAWGAIERHFQGYAALRFWHYYNYLEKSDPQVDYVLTTDIRDVYFQDDPFAHTLQGDIEIFTEDPSRVIKDCTACNASWIHKLYGQAGLDRVAHNTISCSGTTIGTRAGMLRYLKTMKENVLAQTVQIGSADQGMHNYLVYTGAVDPVFIYPPMEGPILTIGSLKHVPQDDQRQVVDNNGVSAAIVHQYDRHPQLVQMINERYLAATG